MPAPPVPMVSRPRSNALKIRSRSPCGIPGPLSETVTRTVTRSQVSGRGLVLSEEPLTWLPDARAAGGRATSVTLRIAGQDWTHVPLAAVEDAEKLLRDAKIGKIYEGTSFIQLDTIAKSLLAEGL